PAISPPNTSIVLPFHVLPLFSLETRAAMYHRDHQSLHVVLGPLACSSDPWPLLLSPITHTLSCCYSISSPPPSCVGWSLVISEPLHPYLKISQSNTHVFYPKLTTLTWGEENYAERFERKLDKKRRV
ncbi:unnamed protein product, partial [Ectocarpus sp. 12 AP-2014]